MTPEPSKEEPKGVVPSKADLEKAHKLVTDYFCFHEKDLMRNGESNGYWIQKQTQDIAQALAELRAEEEKKVEYYQSQFNHYYTLAEKVTLENESLKAELHEATLRASEYKNEWESALYREQGLKSRNEELEAELQATRKACDQAHQNTLDRDEEIDRLKAENERLQSEAGYHGAKETIDCLTDLVESQKLVVRRFEDESKRLTSALARAQEALLECEVDIKDSLGVLSKETEEMVKQALSDPIGQIVFEKWKKMGAVVEAARACYEEDDFITENSPGSFERDKKLGEALEALDAKGASDV